MSARRADHDESGSDGASWALLLFLAAADVACELRSPLPVAAASAATLALACVTLGAASLFYRTARPQPRFAVMCQGLAQVLLFSGLGIILSYLLAREGGELWDSQFAQWDAALGFDWLGYVRSVDAHAWLSLALKLAYASLIPQIVVLVLALGFAGQLRTLRELVFAGMLCGTITILLSPLFPALSSYVHLGLTAADFRMLDPIDGYTQLADFQRLRGGTMPVLSLGDMQGIIAFPSYHAGLAAVSLWSFARCRILAVRWLGMLVALATIASTPVHGGHYLVDVIAGLAIATLSIVAARHAVAWKPTLAPFRSSPSRRSREAFAP